MKLLRSVAGPSALILALVLALGALAGCGRKTSNRAAAPPRPEAPAPEAAAPEKPAAPAAEPAPAEPRPAEPAAEESSQPAPAPLPRAAAPAAETPASSGEGQDFGKEARAIYAAAACDPSVPAPADLDAPTIAAHCAAMTKKIAGYRDHYLAAASPFLAALRPTNLPTTVVYPFGGGDLLSALTTYPDATEITTLSLEMAGDPRRIDGLDADRLKESLDLVRQSISGLLVQNDSTSENLMKGQRNDIPGQIAFFLVGLAVHGYEPVSLRYFTINDDGSLHYLSAAEIAAMEGRVARPRHVKWTPPDFSIAFANSELTFRRKGDPNAPLRVHRHIGANLSDAALKKTPGILKHLAAKGDVAAMTKAASYLLWNPGFKGIRQCLLDHMVFMVSDSTGVPPKVAKAAGFEQTTYGAFAGSFLDASTSINDDFRALWDGQPHRKLPFRYGYLDSEKRCHMLVTRRAGTVS